VLLALTSYNPEIIANNNDTQYVAFLKGLINSVTKGEGGLKETCYQVHNNSEEMSIFEREQCRNAMKEIEFAKRQYPQAISFVAKYKGGISNKKLSQQLNFYKSAISFQKDCKNEFNTRAAKTMRYWGTDEVGKWHYTNLKEMGADSYKLVLEACKEESWVDAEKSAVDMKMSGLWEKIVNATKITSCSPASDQRQWTKALHENNKATHQKVLTNIAAIDVLLANNETIDNLFEDFNSSDAFEKKKGLQKVSTYCASLITFGDKALESQQRAEQQLQRERQALQQAAAEAQRKEQLRRAAQERQKQINQRANDGVVLD
jgi:hypothetical protein